MLDYLELELDDVVSYLTWMLGIKPGSSAKEASAINYEDSSPNLKVVFL